jgi:GNAT superfamily N-acetyltransferase
MLQLSPVSFEVIQNYFVDFQKKSKCFEMPPETGEIIGIYLDAVLIGYFITQAYDNGSIEINQGYLLPKYRHLNLSKDCTALLEHFCKKAGFKTMLLGTHNRFKAYLKFAKGLGYKPQQLIFSKELI